LPRSPRISSAYLSEAKTLAENPRQLEAYDSQGNCVVLAGPGSGKTKTLTLKLARMLAEDVPAPFGVACITYSQECARELERRLDRLGLRDATGLFVGTLHGFCMRHIVQPYGRLGGLDVPAAVEVATNHQREAAYSAAATRLFGQTRPPFRLDEIGRHRRVHLDDAAQMDAANDLLARFARFYVQELRRRGVIDYDDQILLGHRLVAQHDWVRRSIAAKFPVLAVDEYQDLGIPLDRIVRQLVFNAGVRLFAVGDVDQAIYGFTGADPALLEAISREPGVERVRLELNYRSAGDIVAASELVLGEVRGYAPHDPNRKATIAFRGCPEGLEQQAKMVATELIPQALAAKPGRQPGDIAVLYRTAEIGDRMAEALDAARIQYVRNDNLAPYRSVPLTSWIEDAAGWCAGGWQTREPPFGSLLKRYRGFSGRGKTEADAAREAVDLMDFLWDRRDRDRSAQDFVRELETEFLQPLYELNPSLSDQRDQVRRMSAALADDGRLAGATIAQLAGRDGAPDRVNLLTLHSAKGCEYDVVAMIGLDLGIIPWVGEDERSLRESRRLFYVGLTRARDEVHMYCSGWVWNRRFGRRENNGISPFVRELHDRLKEKAANN
jgi:DNA helicase II / ATP-dependent DNA helicase PcrA